MLWDKVGRVISIRAPEDPGATALRDKLAGDYQISIHAPEDPGATVKAPHAYFQHDISTHAPEDPGATANNGLVKPLQRFTAETNCFELAKASLNKTST